MGKCESCSKRAGFGFPGSGAVRCAKHKAEGMEDVKSKRCAEPGCTVRPYFDFPGGKGVRCEKHKAEGMENVRSKRCAEPGCKMQPVFDLPGGKGVRCSEHKAEGMGDVKNKRCAEPGCTARPSFGLPGGKGVRCSKHKAEGMEDVVSKRCLTLGCPIHACFPARGKIACTFHAAPDMFPLCTLCAFNRVRQKGMCADCRGHTKEHHEKEMQVQRALDKHGTLRHYSSRDRAHPCSKAEEIRLFRADFCWELEDVVVILEVDEEAHRRYIARCELARLTDLQAVFKKAIRVIRYNPDAAWVRLGKRKRGAVDGDRHDFCAELVLAAIQDAGAAIFSDANVVVHGGGAIQIVYAGYPADTIDNLWETLVEMEAEAKEPVRRAKTPDEV